MADSARLTHVSPGVYSREIELTYAVKSLGITTLGLVGETQKGPAFQPVFIDNWRDFQSMFGGTSTEKFAGSQYPKYELPYIAKSYLSESNQLQVCRVLGLSGYNAGPAWVLTAHATGQGANFEVASKIDRMAVAVIRSRGKYYKYKHNASQANNTTDSCVCSESGYDTLVYNVGEVSPASCTDAKQYNMNALKLDVYSTLDSNGNECTSYSFKGSGETTSSDSGYTYFTASTSNYGRFKIKGFIGESSSIDDTVENHSGGTEYFEYAVSLNPNDSDYILKVLGTSASDGEAPIFVESLYDVAYQQLVDDLDLNGIYTDFTTYTPFQKKDYCILKPADDFLRVNEGALSRSNVGKRYVADKDSLSLSGSAHVYNYQTKRPETSVITSGTGDSAVTTIKYATEDYSLGKIYTVRQFTDSEGKRNYFYATYDSATTTSLSEKALDTMLSENDILGYTSGGTEFKKLTIVKVASDGRYFRKDDDLNDISPITCDMNDYKEAYRFASTPWIVSNLKGDAERIEMNKLFRFHTISDGDNANKEIKISIANIRPDDGCFDVYVRDINDSDGSTQILEAFRKCTLIPGDSNYISYKIGSFDGIYESKSNYITVEVNEGISVQSSVPCGFLGYPMSMFNGLQISGGTANALAPYLRYNLNYDTDLNSKRQYFGLSDITGVDLDIFSYKGQAAYNAEPEYLSQGFHMDSRLDTLAYTTNYGPTIQVDGVSGYTFAAVAADNRSGDLTEAPMITTEEKMIDSIYEKVANRKFTVYFYGGFDGWDIYRDYRSNTDDFKYGKYKGNLNSTNGEGYAINKLSDAPSMGLEGNALNSDYYAYLSAARQFANPESVDINVFATPGIDLVNNSFLSQEIIDMLEEERADSIYVANVPDKPFGASDYVDEMYTPEEIVSELEDTEITSNYTCTYYPWVKYEDTDNNQYIYLSPTKDVVRNMAITDNTTYPWFAPAGISRGDVQCTRAHYITKLADEDTLYEGRINPVKTFASDGVKLWGQKNLQPGDAQLTRIAVRRLLLRMRKLIAIACNGLIFEPNDATTKNKFLSTVTPIMDNIKANRGISDYRIEVDDSTEARERRELPAKIYFKPYKALEYITLDFIVTPESVDFDTI